MSDGDSGFTVHDRRKVKLDEEPAETNEDPPRGRPSGEREGPLPPVDFASFVLGLGQMALVHLGELPEPQSGATARDLSQARHTIDILSMIEEKTRGNLTQDEAGLLRHLLSELRLKYVRLAK